MIERKDSKWPKPPLPALSPQQQAACEDSMKLWHEHLAHKGGLYKLVEQFNHGYCIKHAPTNFIRTLEFGAGTGGQLNFENLSESQRRSYVALDIQEGMAERLRERFPLVQVLVGDCQTTLPFPDGHFDRILAVHVLEHLPNLPAAIREAYRLCDKQRGVFTVVIPCEGGLLYQLGRKFSTQRFFERRYGFPYKLAIEREHINLPAEVIDELKVYFSIEDRSFFPFLLPFVSPNLCIGMTLRPRETDLVAEI